MRAQELEALTAIYEADGSMEVVGEESDFTFRITVPREDQDTASEIDKVVLTFQLPEEYPDSKPVLLIDPAFNPQLALEAKPVLAAFEEQVSTAAHRLPL